MSVIYLLLSISIIVALIFFIAFIVSVRSGQYDDSYTPSVRMLFDDELVKESSTKQAITSEKKLQSNQTDRKAALVISNKKSIQLNKSLNN
ncbi:cbb3-type cytochrome oxidase assembly protein CcoS [Cellulophaga sp. Hel_I_12]|uniref:cbb3-type cytochrome oxidase assembly protein CcoS n=1 Tax=Cellulophaga sp. Hel_I_12 TaxID=1249972 RepID=UPI0006914BA8|nr:cbb3-type cytochrome oxidase assembly protein CcoS [Cellulophaga sp. Hel_I_12]